MPPCPDTLDRTVSWLRGIGLDVQVVDGMERATFISHVDVQDGVLVIDRECPPSNLLHEAGHLAIMPAQFRPLASGDLEEVTRAMLELCGELQPDEPLYRAIIQTSDPEATAWAWAAGLAIGLEPKVIILDDEYDGDGADVRGAVSVHCHPGIHGLAHAGFCRVRGEPRYPTLKMWLQPVIPALEREVAPGRPMV